MKHKSMAAGVAALAFGTCAHAASWSMADDFAVSNTPNGQWQYGYYALYPSLGNDLSPDPQQFTPISIPDDGLSYSGYVTPHQSSLSIIRYGSEESVTVLPGFAPYTAFYAPVVRWTAPETSIYRFNGSISYLSTSGNITWVAQASIRQANSTIATAYLGQKGDILAFNGDLALNAGETIDFIAAKGQPLLSYAAVITAVPEPGNYALFLSGVSVLLLAKRKRAGSISNCNTVPSLSGLTGCSTGTSMLRIAAR
jgi:hypothetical protein